MESYLALTQLEQCLWLTQHGRIVYAAAQAEGRYKYCTRRVADAGVNASAGRAKALRSRKYAKISQAHSVLQIPNGSRPFECDIA
jgi:hypothetical protein